ncbi:MULTISPECIES: hypothetical protein [unclassified Peribacillus]|uniref:hypothetical protein n=1 Tax=unclassified Peribacillus TaxID=2675266 RepID=UPI00366F7C37
MKLTLPAFCYFAIITVYFLRYWILFSESIAPILTISAEPVPLFHLLLLCCIAFFTVGFTDAVLSTTVFDFAQNLIKIIFAQKNPAFLLDTPKYKSLNQIQYF